MVAVHQNCDSDVLGDAKQNIVDVAGDDDAIITITAIHEVCWQDGFVVPLVLKTVHVVDLESIAGEGEKQRIS